MSRAAVDGYTGEGEPPCSCIIMTPKEQTKNSLNFGVQLHNGVVLSSSNRIKILRVTEQSLHHRFSSSSQGNLMFLIMYKSFHRYRIPCTSPVSDSHKRGEYVCGVFYAKQNLNVWKVIFAFFPRNKLDVSCLFICVMHACIRINSCECRKWSKSTGVVTLVQLLMFTLTKNMLSSLLANRLIGGAASLIITSR